MHQLYESQSEMSNNVNGFTFMYQEKYARILLDSIVFLCSIRLTLPFKSLGSELFGLAILKEINTLKDALNDQIIYVTKCF